MAAVLVEEWDDPLRAAVSSDSATCSDDSYGKATVAITPERTVKDPFGFAGEYRDEETGLVCLRARYYDPSTGQFLTRDPIEAITRSAYGYVYNNPINLVDPTGLGVLDTIGGFFVGEGCGDNGLLGGIGDLASGLWDHRIGALQIVSVGLAVTALAIAPATGGTSLAALPTILGAGSIGSSVLAEAIDPKPGRAQRVTFALGLGLLGGSVAGSFSEGGLAAVGLVMDILLIGGDFIEVGQPNLRYG